MELRDSLAEERKRLADAVANGTRLQHELDSARASESKLQLALDKAKAEFKASEAMESADTS